MHCYTKLLPDEFCANLQGYECFESARENCACLPPPISTTRLNRVYVTQAKAKLKRGVVSKLLYMFL